MPATRKFSGVILILSAFAVNQMHCAMAIQIIHSNPLIEQSGGVPVGKFAGRQVEIAMMT